MSKKMRPPTESEARALDLARRQYKLGKEYEKLEPKNMVEAIRKDYASKQLQDLSTFKRVPEEVREYEAYQDAGYKKGGKVSSASKRADGCAIRGKTKGKMV